MTVQINNKRDSIISEKYLKDIIIGDYVEIKENQFEQVMTVSRHEGMFKILAIELEGNNRIELTGEHFVLIQRKGSFMRILAEEVNEGDNFYKENKLIKVVRIEINNCNLLINVRTNYDTIIINKILCSIYSQGDAGRLGNFVLSTSGKIHKELPQTLKNFAQIVRRFFK